VSAAAEEPIAAEGSKPRAATNEAEPEKKQELPLGLRIGGYLQGEYQANQLSEDQLQQGGTPINQDRFLLRRARLRFDRDWDYASGSFEFDVNTVSGVSVGIRRAEAALVYRQRENPAGVPLAQLTLGVTDIPFGWELAESARSRYFMERSVSSGALFPSEADAAVKVSGGIAFFRYAVALMNGEPLDKNGFPRDPNAAKDVIGRVGVEIAPTDAFKLWGGSSFATGKGFHAGQDAGKDTLTWRDEDGNGSIVGGANNTVQTNELAVIPGSAATPSENFERWALGLDVGATLTTPLGQSKLYGEAYLASNYDRGFAQADPVASGADIRHFGGYIAALQDVTRYGIVGFRAAFFDPNSDLLEVRAGRPLPYSQTVTTLSPLAGLVLRDRARLLFEYDFVLDEMARDERGVPTDAKNDQITVRLQVEL
jgi:hypothetical protein